LNSSQRLPEFCSVAGNLLKYRWVGEQGDFAYPIEVSSSLYRSSDIHPLLRKIRFKNPNTLEAELAACSAWFARKRPQLLCYESSRTFCVPLNLVQSEFENRAAEGAEFSPQHLGRLFDEGWRVDVARLAGFDPPACHHILPLPQVRDASLSADAAHKLVQSGNSDALTCSVVIPCFNQGRFLTDCLESLACQTEAPLEVFVVNDGSTDPDTIELFGRLSDYAYPFPLQVLHKANGGLSSARNFGIDRSRGDFILPLDADDKLTPDALKAYREAFARQPQVDFLYPDIAAFGNESWVTPGPGFNAWWLTQVNFMVSSSAVRRRVFDAGYRYDERLRAGYEDWEFWIRTCSLGPFIAAPLRLSVFCYRRWGFSMLAAVDQRQVLSQIRALHTAAGLWNDEVESRLRRQHAPSHCVFTSQPEDLPAANDLRAISRDGVGDFVAQDRISRFLWFGSFPAEWTGAMQLAVNETTARTAAAAFVFVDVQTQEPYCVVIDRFWVLRHPFRYHRPVTDVSPVAYFQTSGVRQLLVRQVVRKRRLGQAVQALLPAPLPAARNGDLLPRNHESDSSIAKETWHFLQRSPQATVCVHALPGQKVLVAALPWLIYGGADFAFLALLEEGTIRSQFDKIVLVVFNDGDHPAHGRFENLVDSVVHLGNLGLEDEAKLDYCVALCRSLRATDFFINNSQHGYDLIPRLRQAKLPLRITAQIHGFEMHPRRQTLTEGYPKLLAIRYANLIDRVASVSDALTSRMTDELYFPRSKIRTVRLGIDQSRFNPSCRKRPSGPKQIAWIARLDDNKDPIHAFEVAREFHSRDPETRFVFVGNGPLATVLSKRIRQARRSGMNIAWIPQTDKVETVLQQSDCLFMTSHHEGIPIVVMEAFSCGIPVVMSHANTAAVELADCGTFRVVADRRSTDEFCERLREALNGPEARTLPVELSQQRYASEMLHWLFESSGAARQSQNESVFGINAAA
jgi:glycosyltransferase involved in cell wall biosynthesis